MSTIPTPAEPHRYPYPYRLADDRVAYYAEETASWWIVSEDDWARLEEMEEDGEEDAYSRWCSETSTQEVDALDHDTLDAICDAGGDAEEDYGCQCGEAMGERCVWSGHRAELHLVRWVPDADRGSAKASGTYTRGAYARRLYCEASCASRLAHVWEDGEETDALDPYVRDCGPAYAEAQP